MARALRHLTGEPGENGAWAFELEADATIPAELARRVRGLHPWPGCRVKVLSGSPRIRVLLRPRFDWGRARPTITQGSTHIRFVSGNNTLRVNTDAPIAYVPAMPLAESA